jgi:hypothetical protein
MRVYPEVHDHPYRTYLRGFELGLRLQKSDIKNSRPETGAKISL